MKDNYGIKKLYGGAGRGYEGGGRICLSYVLQNLFQQSYPILKNVLQNVFHES